MSSINVAVFFSQTEIEDQFKSLMLPDFIKIISATEQNISEVDCLIVDGGGLFNSVQWMEKNNIYPGRVILVNKDFDPVVQIKKETILISNLDVLKTDRFWEVYQNKKLESDEYSERYSFLIENIYQIGGVVDSINFFFQKRNFLSLNEIESLNKLGQFVSSLLLNESISPPAQLICHQVNEMTNEIEVKLLTKGLDPIFLIDYLHLNNPEYFKNLIMSSFEKASYAFLEYNGDELNIRLNFTQGDRDNVIYLKIDKTIESLKRFLDSENLTAEKSGLLLDFTNDIVNMDYVHPGVIHRPDFDPKRKSEMEDLVVRVIGKKENFNDQFDLDRVKEILNEEPFFRNKDFSDDELERVRDLSNDIESTIALARAKDDLFSQIIDNGSLETEVFTIMDTLGEEDLTNLIIPKGEIDLESDDKIIVKEPESFEITDSKIIIAGEEIDKVEINKTLINLRENIKDELIKVKDNIKNKEDWEKFVIKVIDEKNPELNKFGRRISNNLASNLLNDKMNKIVYSNNSWKKMREMMNSFRKKIELKEKEVKSLKSTLDTLTSKNSEMHPVFKEIVDNTEKNKFEGKSTEELSKIIARKDFYIKKLEDRLIDKQKNELSIIRSGSSDIVNNEVILRKGSEETKYFSEIDDKSNDMINIDDSNELFKMDETKTVDIKKYEKMRNLGVSMARKLNDINTVLKDFKARNTELLIERNTLVKENQRISLLERRARNQVEELERKMFNLQDNEGKRQTGEDKNNGKESIIETNLKLKIEKLENLNEKLSEGAKSLAKKITQVQNDYNKARNEKKSVEQKLKYSEAELLRIKDSIHRMRKNKAS